MKILRKREGSIKKEETSSSSSGSDSSSSETSSDSDSEMEEKYKPSSTNQRRVTITKRRSSCRSSSSTSDRKGDIKNTVPIEIDSDPILIQSSDEEICEKSRLEKEEQERIKVYQVKVTNTHLRVKLHFIEIRLSHLKY